MPTDHKEKKITDRRPLYIAACIVIIIGGGSAALAYIGASSKSISIDNASLSAPLVDLSPVHSGVLNAIYVTPSEVVPPGTVVAEVGTELIKSTSGGLVITVNSNIGKTVSPADVVVETIDPKSLRVVGKIDENKGLTRVHVGDAVSFTVDAFGGQEFTGVIDEVSPTANQTGIVFNISNSRETQQFDVKARFDTSAYPQLKNGMSARMKIFVQ